MLGDAGRALGRLALRALVLLVRLSALALVVLCAYVLAGALVGRNVQSPAIRSLVGLLCAIALPLAVQGQIAQLVRRFARVRVVFGTVTFWTAFDVGLIVLMTAGWGQEAGRALRRHGDWFLGQRVDRRAQIARACLRFAAARLEHFDLPPEMRTIVIPVDRGLSCYGPAPADGAATLPPPVPARFVWFHPLADPARQLPLWEDRRFGAERAHASPEECELGHCGVDLLAELGQPVYAVYDGVVERLERDAHAGGRAGRYLRIGHVDGKIVTRYIHLDHIRVDLREGDHVVAGEPIALAGRTGVHDSGTHLHFALSMRPGGPDGREIYVDPEPYLLRWEVPAAAPFREVEPVPAHRLRRSARASIR